MKTVIHSQAGDIILQWAQSGFYLRKPKGDSK